MSVHARQSPKRPSRQPAANHPATRWWLIDAQGREMAITDDMIQQACVAWSSLV